MIITFHVHFSDNTSNIIEDLTTESVLDIINDSHLNQNCIHFIEHHVTEINQTMIIMDIHVCNLNTKQQLIDHLNESLLDDLISAINEISQLIQINKHQVTLSINPSTPSPAFQEYEVEVMEAFTTTITPEILPVIQPNDEEGVFLPVMLILVSIVVTMNIIACSWCYCQHQKNTNQKTSNLRIQIKNGFVIPNPEHAQLNPVKSKSKSQSNASWMIEEYEMVHIESMANHNAKYQRSAKGCTATDG